MSSDNKLVDLIFKGQVFKQHGYTYKYKKFVNDGTHETFYFEWIPDYYPHSYFISKLFADCNEIISDRLKYVGWQLVSTNAVDVSTPISDLKKTLFIKKSLLKQIDESVGQLKSVKLEVPKEKKTYLLGLDLKLMETPYYDRDTGEYVSLRFNLSINNINEIVGSDHKLKPVKINPNVDLKYIRTFIEDSLYDHGFAGAIDDIIIPILEPEIQLGNYDLFYNSIFTIDKISGSSTKDLSSGNWRGNETDEYFI